MWTRLSSGALWAAGLGVSIVGWLFLAGRILLFLAAAADDPSTLLVWGGAALLASGLLALLIHECGHAAIGICNGWPILCFQILGLALVREGNGYRLRWGYSSGHPLGSVTCAFKDASAIRLRLALFYCGGILANLVASSACLLLALWVEPFRDPRPEVSPRRLVQPSLRPTRTPVPFLSFLSALNGLLLSGSLMPYSARRFSSDGKLLVDLLAGDPTIWSHLAAVLLSDRMMHGVRPRAWGPPLLDRLLAPVTTEADMTGVHIICYYYYLDIGDFGSAGDYLGTVLANWKRLDPRTKGVVANEAAYFKGFHLRDAVTARAWLNRISGVAFETHTRLRGEAAVLLAEGRFEEAIALCEAALAAVPDSIDRGGRQAERDLLEAMRNEGMACRVNAADPKEVETPAPREREPGST